MKSPPLQCARASLPSSPFLQDKRHNYVRENQSDLIMATMRQMELQQKHSISHM